jgi:tetratricopeptide (TPR) repeat protein
MHPRYSLSLTLWTAIAALLAGCDQPPSSSTPARDGSFVGSQNCRECHAKFYELWSTSWHGLAMQPYTAAFAKNHLTPQSSDITIDGRHYRAEIGSGQGAIVQRGPDGERRYPIAHVMGGKNIDYFLTPMPGGRLHILPLAYDVHRKTWYDMAASGVRHFVDSQDAALPWTDRLFTFNTTCFGCHVSQLSTTYDFAADTYHTTWNEAGISCESCHGPGAEHVKAMQALKPDESPQDLKIIQVKSLTHQQRNDMCAVCHAKMIPLSNRFTPGDKFFDHFDLITLESPEFYPDGRDLGENYTQTTWLASPCQKSGTLDCLHCHTSSGRFRFSAEKRDQACMPCHQKYVADPLQHGHHQAASSGNGCIGCHMPATRFAGMMRTDHSMRPPTPEATIQFKSPNACNICHTDRDAEWSNNWVAKWYPTGYQSETIRRAQLVDAARKSQWHGLPQMLADIADPGKDEVYRNSLVRLLDRCSDSRKWPTLIAAAQKDSSPLVRASAVTALQPSPTPENIAAIAAALQDDTKLVRVRAAAVMAAAGQTTLHEPALDRILHGANRDFMSAMAARPDDWASYLNLGNFAMGRGEYGKAAEMFEKSHRLEPRIISPLVNAAMAYTRLNQLDKTESLLREAIKIEPKNPAANFNLGLLLAEQGQPDAAEAALRIALEFDPDMAPAAYNLAILQAEKHRLDEAIANCRTAHRLRPEDPKYAFTLAFYLRQKGDTPGAIDILKNAATWKPLNIDACVLLAQIYQELGNREAIAKLRRDLKSRTDLPDDVKRMFQVDERLPSDQ